MATIKNSAFFLVIYNIIASVLNIPIDTNNFPSLTNQPYDFDNYDEVYDRRQSNGSENIQVDIDDVAIVIVPPKALLDAAAFLISPSLLNFGSYPESEETFTIPEEPEKPIEDFFNEKPKENVTVITTITTKAPEVAAEDNLAPGNATIIVQSTEKSVEKGI